MKVIIAGSRTITDYDLICRMCDRILSEQTDIEIVSGTARGVDKLGERYAKERDYILHKFPADWDKYGKGAGYLRNEEMAKYADALIAFWDGSSKGTKNMIDLANRYGLKIRVIEGQ